MARSWRDYGAGGPTCDNSDNRDKRSSEGLGHRCFVPNVSFVRGLPPTISTGLKALRSMAAPRLCRPEAWPAVVSDALSLANDGWAAKALALGWSDLDLYGAVSNAGGDPYSDGLAAWLGGRKLLAICSTFAIAEDGNGRAYFNRCEQVGAKLLWELHA